MSHVSFGPKLSTSTVKPISVIAACSASLANAQSTLKQHGGCPACGGILASGVFDDSFNVLLCKGITAPQCVWIEVFPLEVSSAGGHPVQELSKAV